MSCISLSSPGATYYKAAIAMAALSAVTAAVAAVALLVFSAPILYVAVAFASAALLAGGSISLFVMGRRAPKLYSSGNDQLNGAPQLNRANVVIGSQTILPSTIDALLKNTNYSFASLPKIPSKNVDGTIQMSQMRESVMRDDDQLVIKLKYKSSKDCNADPEDAITFTEVLILKNTNKGVCVVDNGPTAFQSEGIINNREIEVLRKVLNNNKNVEHNGNIWNI